MDKPRKVNPIEIYFDEGGTRENKSTSRLFPHGNYQTWVYFNAKGAEPDSIIFLTVALTDQEDAFAGVPMFYIGTFEKDGETYHRWETPLPNIAYNYFRKDKEVPLWFQFIEEEPNVFGGIYDDLASIPEGFEEGTYVYILDEEKIYELTSEPDTWEEATSLLTFGQTWGYDIAKVFVAKGLRLNKAQIDPDITQTILSYLAQIQANIGGVANLEEIDGVAYNNVVSAINAVLALVEDNQIDIADLLSQIGNINELDVLDGVTYSNLVGFVNALNDLKLNKDGSNATAEIEINGVTFDLGAPTDAVSEAYGDSRWVNKTGDSMSGDLSMENNSINFEEISDIGDLKTGDLAFDGKHLVFKANSLTHTVGAQMYDKFRNNSGSTINALTPVMVKKEDPSTGDNINIVPANKEDYNWFAGFSCSTINNNETGGVVTKGVIRRVNTSSWGEGSVLYLTNTPGIITTTRPSEGLIVPVAIVVRQHSTQGKLKVIFRTEIENLYFNKTQVNELLTAHEEDPNAHEGKIALLLDALDLSKVDW